jgi:hypothetical protein
MVDDGNAKSRLTFGLGERDALVDMDLEDYHGS